MEFVLVVYDDNETLVTEAVYAPPLSDKSVISRIPFSTLQDAQNAKMLHQITKLRNADARDELALRDTINTQADIIRKQNTEIETLQADKRRMAHSISEIDKFLEEKKRDIALEIVTEGTHRERNLYYKRVVLSMITIQEVFIQSLWDTEDIPF